MIIVNSTITAFGFSKPPATSALSRLFRQAPCVSLLLTVIDRRAVTFLLIYAHVVFLQADTMIGAIGVVDIRIMFAINVGCSITCAVEF